MDKYIPDFFVVSLLIHTITFSVDLLTRCSTAREWNYITPFYIDVVNYPNLAAGSPNIWL